MADYTEISYNPGIHGFIKAHRHFEGPALVMSRWPDAGRDWAAVYWVKRLHHEASPVEPNIFALQNQRTMKAVERTYDIYMHHGPPIAAYMEPEPDFQRKRVYDWEFDNIFPGCRELSWNQCRSFFRKVWSEVGVGTEPVLTINYRAQRAISFGGRVCLPKYGKHWREHWNKPTLLHEIAHELQFEDKHGPAFVTKYIDLCVNYLHMRRDILLSSAERYGVLVAR